MIASVRGEVLDIALDHAVIEASGVGYRVNATPVTLGALHRGSEARLFTTMIVREDSMTLYGFSDLESKDLFSLLQTVSGVGPRLAMATLAVLEPEALRRALSEGNLTALTRVPGIGKRGAERMVVELRDKVDAVPATAGVSGAVAANAIRDQIVEALEGLGFPSSRPNKRRIPCSRKHPTQPRPSHFDPLSRCSVKLDEFRPDRRLRGRIAGQRRIGGGDGEVEASLRPKSLDDFIGQPRVREQLQLVLTGAKMRGGTPDHILMSGPPGLGKTSMAMIIAGELGSSLRLTSGPALERAGDLAAMLSNLVEGDVLFIDEIHRIARPAEEMLYLAMEDFRVDVVVGKGPGATSIPLEVAPFTLVGATTRSGALTGPLRDRFGFTAHMDFYEPDELQQILMRSAGILGVNLEVDAGAEIARRSRGTPRIANRLLRRVRDFAEVRADGIVTMEVAQAALAVYDVDQLGLDRLDRSVLSALVRSFGGGPVGVSTLAVAVGEEPSTVEEVCEPFLVRAGMIARTPRGRVATAAAWKQLGMTPPPDAAAGGIEVRAREPQASLFDPDAE